MLFHQANDINPTGLSLDTPGGIFVAARHTFDTFAVPPMFPTQWKHRLYMLSDSEPMNCMRLRMPCAMTPSHLVSVAEHDEFSWLLAIISICDHFIVWHSSVCSDHHWLVLNITVINDCLAISSHMLWLVWCHINVSLVGDPNVFFSNLHICLVLAAKFGERFLKI